MNTSSLLSVNQGILPDFLATELPARYRYTTQAGETVALRGFGRFRLRQRPAREGRNPRTGDTVPIPAKAVPTFLAGKAFHELVQTAAALSEGANGRTRVS